MESNEIKKVITVDLGNTSTSLREYKKHIDDLKASLLQLDSESEEYKKIAAEIVKEQNKLNDVMKVGKKETDAADGSYNKLTQTMAELKKQWKATADDAERAELGTKILDINNQLKQLDASTGNFQRNVGDYANAFQLAFNNVLKGVNSIDGPIGQLGATVSSLIPIVKTLNKTAIGGLTGIKKAIASTGIGILIVAVGELVANWDKVKTKVQSMIGIQDTYSIAVERSAKQMEALKEQVKNTTDEISYQARLMKAMGASQIEILNARLQSEKELQKELWDKYDADMAYYNLYKDAGSKSQRKAAELAKERAEETFKEIKAQEDKIKLTKQDIHVEEIVQEQMQKTLELTKETTTETKNLNKEIKERGQLELIDIDPKNGFVNVDSYIKALEDRIDKLDNKLKQDKFDISIVSWDMSSIETIDAIWEKEIEYYSNKLTLLNLEIAAEEKNTERYKELLEERLSTQQEYNNASKKWSEEHKKQNKKDAEQEAKDRQLATNTIISSVASLFGSLSDMSEENSKQQKAFAIMETTINTLAAIMGTWKGYSEFSFVGTAAAIAQTASIIATGAATIAQIKSTTKNAQPSVSNPSVSPSPSMTTVSPLLDEQGDLNKYEMYGLNGNSDKKQNIKVYVVDQDIRDADARAEVIDKNTTF